MTEICDLLSDATGDMVVKPVEITKLSDSLKNDDDEEPKYKPLIVNRSRMLNAQNGRKSRFDIQREEKNKEIVEYNAKLKAAYDNMKKNLS